jgi:hypothetical protein
VFQLILLGVPQQELDKMYLAHITTQVVVVVDRMVLERSQAVATAVVVLVV